MSVRGFQNWRGYGTLLKETTYGDGTSVQDSTWNMDPNLTNEETNVHVNTDEVTSLEEASETDALSHSAGHTHAQRVTPHALAFFGKAAWGVASHTLVSTVGGNVWRHDLFFTTSPGLLPSFGWVENRGGLIRAYPGGVVGRLALNFERNSHVKMEAEVMGSGTFTAVNTVRPSLLTAEPYLKVSQTKVWLGTGAATTTLSQSNTVSNIASAPTALDCVLRSANWELNQNLLAEDGYGFNTNGIRCQLERDQRSQTLGFQLEFDGTSAELARLRAQTNLAMELDMVSGTEIISGSGFYYGANLLFPRLRYTAAAISGGRNKLYVDVTAQLLQQDATNRNAFPAMMSVWNATSSYLL
jgi:hypothetical protein